MEAIFVVLFSAALLYGMASGINSMIGPVLGSVEMSLKSAMQPSVAVKKRSPVVTKVPMATQVARIPEELQRNESWDEYEVPTFIRRAAA